MSNANTILAQDTTRTIGNNPVATCEFIEGNDGITTLCYTRVDGSVYSIERANNLADAVKRQMIDSGAWAAV
ncbi:MAG: hypothetical protein ACYTFV_17610 [Planctomycetota bacterium]|jgi:hypothetical protein